MHFGSYNFRNMNPRAIIVGGIFFLLVIIPVFMFLSRYMEEETMLRDLPEKISFFIKEAKYEEADKLVAQKELKLGEIPNTMTPLRAVAQLHILATQLAERKNIEKEKLAKVKENLQKFKTITNGYRTYRELIKTGERLIELIEDSNGRIFFDKKEKQFRASKF